MEKKCHQMSNICKKKCHIECAGEASQLLLLCVKRRKQTSENVVRHLFPISEDVIPHLPLSHLTSEQITKTNKNKNIIQV